MLHGSSVCSQPWGGAVNIHEYQAKELLKAFGIPVLPGACATCVAEAVSIAQGLKGPFWVLKAQIHGGGRGKAGGIRIARTLEEVATLAQEMIGMRLVTPQTGPAGKCASLLYVVEGTEIAQEFYLSLLVDRRCARLTFVLSKEGGMGIEELASRAPEKIFSVSVNPTMGLQPFHVRSLAQFLGLKEEHLPPFTSIVEGVYRGFTQLDCELIEINPLVLTPQGQLLALDAKIVLEDNAFFRHPQREEMRDPSQDNPLETQARQLGINYIKLDGNIGCMFNGAGLAMATMDLLHLLGGRPANFLDVGAGASGPQIGKALRMLLTDGDVKGVLVNIFGGMIRCDLIAQSLVEILGQHRPCVPIVVRLVGNAAEKGYEILRDAPVPLEIAMHLEEAAHKIVRAVQPPSNPQGEM